MKNMIIMPLCGIVFRNISKDKRCVMSYEEDDGELFYSGPGENGIDKDGNDIYEDWKT
jgi:hypothetical protein